MAVLRQNLVCNQMGCVTVLTSSVSLSRLDACLPMAGTAVKLPEVLGGGNNGEWNQWELDWQHSHFVIHRIRKWWILACCSVASERKSCVSRHRKKIAYLSIRLNLSNLEHQKVQGFCRQSLQVLSQLLASWRLSVRATDLELFSFPFCFVWLITAVNFSPLILKG